MRVKNFKFFIKYLYDLILLYFILKIVSLQLFYGSFYAKIETLKIKKLMYSILFPGRHHMLTKFQKQYLRDAVNDGINGKKVEQIIFAITSANHENTRRNPLPLYLRTMAIARFAEGLPCKVKIYAIPDLPKSTKFAQFMLNHIFYQSGEKLTPKNTILACSTPPVIKLFKKYKFDHIPVELLNESKNKYASLRPFEVVDLIVKAGKNWRHEKEWKHYASEATQDLYLEYGIGDLINELFADQLLNEDADITDTRNYQTYGSAMDRNVSFKFDDIKPFIVEGKIVDAGCGTGALINILAKEFDESDIIGIEGTRKFYEYCKAQDYGDAFVFFYRRNLLDQNFKKNTINTFIYSSVLHEVYSYIGEKELLTLLKITYDQLALGGRIIIRDVVGPENPNQVVYMELNDKDGREKGPIDKLSTYAKFFHFAVDFGPRKIRYKKVKINGKNYIETTLQNAYEYISKMSYTDNWASEMHEEFGFYSFPQWKKVLGKVGFRVVEGSRAFHSQYIVEKKYAGKARLFVKKGKSLVETAYPPTNMILAGEKTISS